jgi:hypothetical protein
MLNERRELRRLRSDSAARRDVRGTRKEAAVIGMIPLERERWMLRIHRSIVDMEVAR